MGNLPNQHAYKRKHHSTLKADGFIHILLLPLVALIGTGFLGLSSLGLAIKNLSQAESLCIKQGLHLQKQLSLHINQLLNLNKISSALYRKKSMLKQALRLAIKLKQLYMLPGLKGKIYLITLKQKSLKARQKHLLHLSEQDVQAGFTMFKTKMKQAHITNIRKNGFFHKAIAVVENKLSLHASIYQLAPSFSRKQTWKFLWSIQPLYGLYDNLKYLGLKKFTTKQDCAFTLANTQGKLVPKLTYLK